MRTRPFGRSDVVVSEVCLGTMAFGSSIAAEEGLRMLATFAGHGGTFVDAANTFGAGEGERILGKALRGDRQRFVVGTKFGRSTDPADPAACGNGRANLVRSLDESLRRLGTDHVDVLWAHAWDERTPPEELARGLEEVLASGKARAVGIADAPAWGIAHVDGLLARRGARIDGVILEHGLAARDAERELLPMTRTLGMTALAWGLTSGDLLLGDAASIRARVDSSADYYARHRAAAALHIGTTLQAVAAARGLDRATVALGWSRARQPDLVPVLGAKTDVELRARLAVLAHVLDEEALAQLDEASRIDLGFPAEYLRDPSVVREIYGDRAGRSTPD